MMGLAASRGLTQLEAFTTALGVGTERRIDFLTALRDVPPHDIQRLYWLARVTLVTRLEDIPFFDAVFASFFLGAPPQPAPAEEGDHPYLVFFIAMFEILNQRL